MCSSPRVKRASFPTRISRQRSGQGLRRRGPHSSGTTGSGHRPRRHQGRSPLEEEIAVQINTKAVHAGDRKKPGPAVPTTTPIYGATTYAYEKMDDLDRIFGREVAGYSYSRYDNPTNSALEEL